MAERRSLSFSGSHGAMLTTFREQDHARVCGIMFQTAAEGLVVVDAKGLIRLQNPRLAELFGYKDEELVGQPIEKLVPEAIASGHRAHRDRYLEKPQQRPMGSGLELRGRRKDGSEFPVEVSLNHFEVDGERFVMGLVTDVTLRKRAEHELAATLSDLEARVEQRTGELRQAEHNVREALERERELNELKSRFVSMASHEFRTPLSTIMSSVDLIGRYTDDARNEKVGKHVDRIRGKVRELTGILNDFLSLDKLEQGLVACHPAPFDVLDLCIGLIEEMRTLAKPGQAVHFDHAGEVREACTDRQMLSNVVSNLLSNAIKYSPEDRPIHLRTAITNGTLSIQVEDQGIGIPEKDQVHLFERFFRAGNTVSIQGTGLGLNIVRKYLDMMGGSIRFDSREGAGTTFFVEIPMTSESPH